MVKRAIAGIPPDQQDQQALVRLARAVRSFDDQRAQRSDAIAGPGPNEGEPK